MPRKMRKGRIPKPASDGQVETEAQIESGAEIADPKIDPRRVYALQEEARQRRVWSEGDCSIGWEFYWQKDGKDYSYYVSGETIGVRVEHNQEFLGGNRHFTMRYRGNVLVDTNDPRLKKHVERDPGPQIWADGDKGTRVMSVKEFLKIINGNKADRRWVYGKR